jgi:hypothetical protein
MNAEIVRSSAWVGEPNKSGAPDAELCGAGGVRVLPMPTGETESWLLNRHYAKRRCPISYAFGAYRGAELIGVVTYGTPPSSTLCRGLCGDEWADKVLELNRLCCENTKNVASTLVGRSLRLLPKPSIVVSYADTAQGHVGYIYQATNFVYTGLSAKITDLRRSDDPMETGHDLRLSKERGGLSRQELLANGAKLVERSRKHRYVFACGSRKQRATIVAALRYPVESYPKGESRHYDVSGEVKSQMILL